MRRGICQCLLVRHEVQSSVDTKLLSLQNDVKQQCKNHTRNPTPRSRTSGASVTIEQQLAKSRHELARETTMVVGSLQSLDGLHAATTWFSAEALQS